MTWVKEDIGSTTVRRFSSDRPRESRVVAGIALCLWAVASIPGHASARQILPTDSRSHRGYRPDTSSPRCSPPPCSSNTPDGGGGKDTALKTGESHTFLARASRLDILVAGASSKLEPPAV